jgi:GntR family transcriptional regulator, rspAB operon transcriptional repressor
MDSLKSEVYENLKYRIIVKQLEPGESLKEKEILKEYGIGRTPLREIFIRLQDEGLIQRFPRSGTIVAPIDLNQLKEVTQIRLPLESLVSELVIERITENQIEQLKEILVKVEDIEETGSDLELVSYDTKLHNYLYSVTGNRKLIKLIQELQAVGSRFWFSITFTREEYLDQLEQWKEIVDAIARRDKELTKKLIYLHIQKSVDSIRARL